MRLKEGILPLLPLRARMDRWRSSAGDTQDQQGDDHDRRTPVPPGPSGLDDGRGFFIEWQAGIGFMAGFMYDDTGAPVWYIAANPKTSNARLFSSQWEKYINGQTLTGAYHPPVRPPTYVGPATIQFSGPANAVMTMPGGAQVTLSRYRF